MDKKGAFTLYADDSVTGERLDVFVSTHLTELSRSYITSLIKNAHIKVCGAIRKPGYRIKSGDTITGILPPIEPSVFLPEPMDLSVLYEDDHIIVIDKPAGLIVHPAPGHSSGTLVNGLLHHCPDLKGIGGEIRPGIVHRLDKDTSGVMVAAKDDFSHHDLAVQFKSRSIKKEYIALVYGELTAESGKIDLPIGRHPTNRKKMSTNSRKGRLAETEWSVKKRFNGLSLARIILKTGRTHQIRVHFTAINHPIVGDPVYAGRKALNRLPKEMLDLIKPIKRQLLHAHRLVITHPKTKTVMSFTSQLPKDMTDILKTLSTS